MFSDLDTLVKLLDKIFNYKGTLPLDYTMAHEHIINKTLINQGKDQVISYIISLRDGEIDSETIQGILKEE